MLTLTACSETIETLNITSKPTEKPELVLPDSDQLSLRPVEWIVINKDNYESVFAELEKSSKPVALFALTGEGYENLGLNFSDIRQLVQQQQSIIMAYKDYTKKQDIEK